MDADQENKVAHIKEQIEQGTYRVDPQAVADAILRRLRELTGVDAGASVRNSAQNECS